MIQLRTCGQTKSTAPDLWDVTSRLFWPGALFEHATSFQDRKRAACSSPTGRMEHVFIWGKSFRWYIKHQSKVSFPLTFLVLSPSKGHGPLYWAHMHTRDQKKNKQRPFKYQPTCLLFEWRSYCRARPGLVQHAGVTCSAIWGMDVDQTGEQRKNKALVW